MAVACGHPPAWLWPAALGWAWHVSHRVPRAQGDPWGWVGDPQHLASPSPRSARPLHSLSVLAFDQERLERKVGATLRGWGWTGGLQVQAGLSRHPLAPQILALRQARRPVPPEVAQQYQDTVQRSQWQRAQLEQGGASIRRGRAPEGRQRDRAWDRHLQGQGLKNGHLGGQGLRDGHLVGQGHRVGIQMPQGRGLGRRVGRGAGLLPDHPPPAEYAAQLERQLQFYTEAARRLGNDGSRVSGAGPGEG